MNRKHPPSQPHDFDPDLENDAVWSLLGDASSEEPAPSFVQDTLRRARLEEGDQSLPWWRRILSPKPLLGAALASSAVAVAVVLITSNPADPVGGADHPDNTAQVEPTDLEPEDDFLELEDAIASELLSGAAENPSLLSDGEIVALLY